MHAPIESLPNIACCSVAGGQEVRDARVASTGAELGRQDPYARPERVGQLKQRCRVGLSNESLGSDLPHFAVLFRVGLPDSQLCINF